MKVRMSSYNSLTYNTYRTDDSTMSVDIDDDLYNEYVEIEKKYNELQKKLRVLHSEYSLKIDRARNERKIEALKKEIIELEGKI